MVSASGGFPQHLIPDAGEAIRTPQGTDGRAGIISCEWLDLPGKDARAKRSAMGD